MGVKKIKKMVDVMRKFEKKITPKRQKSAFNKCVELNTSGKITKGQNLTEEQLKANRATFKAAAKACQTDPSVVASKNDRVAAMKRKLGV